MPTSRAEVLAKPAKMPAAGLAADDALELAHHPREGVRAHDRAEAVMRVVDARDPLAHRFVHRVLERPAPGGDRHDGRAEQLHAKDVEGLAHGVDLAHEDRALEAETSGRGSGGDAVLAGAGLGDHPVLAHALGQERLSDHVVDLVGPRVREVLALGVEADAELLREPLEVGHRRRPPRELAQHSLVLVHEGGVVPGFDEGALQLQAGRHQGLGNKAAPKVPESAPRVGR
jgi:hypothetical protein